MLHFAAVRLLILSLLFAGCSVQQKPHRTDDVAKQIHAAATADDHAWRTLAQLCDEIGHRLSGSESLDKAIAWAQKTMTADGAENVRAEKVMVPKWVRGRESCEMTEPRRHPMPMLGLGGSIATPAEGITAEVVVARSKDDLRDAKGKIVVWNYPMPKFDPVKGARYGETVAYRVNGAQWASEKGAVAALVRSVTATSFQSPHTGGMRYGDAPKIPTASITIEDAEMIARLVERGIRVVVTLKMEARDEGLVPSANVIGELVGREKPDEVVVISGHLDSWDLGQGAQDDGSGCVAAMDAIRVLRKLGLRPRRTIRVVLWTNEENGLGGARQYVKDHAAEMAKHVAAIEMDHGCFKPRAYSIDHKDKAALDRMSERLRPLIAPLAVIPGGSAADVGQMKEAGVPLLGFEVENSRYFDYHHTHADTMDKVDPKELAECVAVMATTAYALAEMPGRLDD